MSRIETIGNATIRFGDCRESMRSMIAEKEKVQMCVTSPPYFGLRDYGHDGQLGLDKRTLRGCLRKVRLSAGLCVKR